MTMTLEAPTHIDIEVVAPQLYRMSVEKYLELVHVGHIPDNPQIELLDGLLVEKMPGNPPHDGVLDLLKAWFGKNIPNGCLQRNDQGLQLSTSVVRPDLSIVRGNPRSFLKRHPTGEQTLFVLEVAWSSLSIDRRIKNRLYSQAGIPVYWIVNLAECCIEVYTQPDPAGDYQAQTIYTSGQSVPVLLDGVVVATVPVEEFLP
ncbi:MAG: Uma2 family endonuclease [Gemmataceae bacterium]